MSEICDGFRMPAVPGDAANYGGRHPKASRKETHRLSVGRSPAPPRAIPARAERRRTPVVAGRQVKSTAWRLRSAREQQLKAAS
jgi:hypothetical protein